MYPSITNQLSYLHLLPLLLLLLLLLLLPGGKWMVVVDHDVRVLKPFSLTYVRYEKGDVVGQFLSLITLTPMSVVVVVVVVVRSSSST